MKKCYLPVRLIGLALTLVLFVGLFQANAQCTPCSTCDTVLTPSNPYINYDSMANYAGKKICIQAGYYNSRVGIANLQGTAEDPILVTNCDGQVVIEVFDTGTNLPALQFYNAQHVKILGNGCPDSTETDYGIWLKHCDTNWLEIKDGLGGQGVPLEKQRVSDIEIAHIEIGYTSGTPGAAGIKIIDQPGACDSDTIPDREDERRWIIRNLKLHDNLVHNVGGEGMYIGKGNSWYFGSTTNCGEVQKTSYSVSIRGVEIYDNDVQNVGWDGIQLKDADENVKVYNNYVANYGLLLEGAHNEGIFLGAGTVGDVYNNLVINGPGYGFDFRGLGNLNVYNNLIVNSGEQGMYFNPYEYPMYESSSYIQIINNTIVKTGSQGIYLHHDYDTISDRIVVNNIVVGVDESVHTPHIIKGNFTENSNNILDQGTPGGIGFESYQESTAQDFIDNDYHLRDTSIAVNGGKAVNSYGVSGMSSDLDGNPRPYNDTTDVGAYEYQGDSTGGGGGGSGTTVLYRVNAGGAEESDSTMDWETDKVPDNESAYFDDENCVNYTTGPNLWNPQQEGTVNNTGAPNNLFGNYRYDNGAGFGDRQHWDFPVENGDYEVRLYFNARDSICNVSVFDVSIEGNLVLDEYSVSSEAGGQNIPVVETFNVTVTDSNLDIDLPSITTGRSFINGIEILAANTQPVLATIGNQSVDEGDTLQVNISASDGDGDSLSFSATNLPSFATLTDHGNDTATLTVNPGSGDAGTYTNVEVTVSDGNGGEDSETFTIAVNAAGGVVLFRVNAGGALVSDAEHDWETDKQNNESDYFDHENCVNYTTGPDLWDPQQEGTVNNTGAPNNLFGNYRFDNGGGFADRQHWDFPVENGDYEIRLYFNARDSICNVSVFDVSIEGTSVLDEYSVSSEAGGQNIPVVETFNATVTDSNLEIDFPTITTGRSFINGIEIITTSSSRISEQTENLTATPNRVHLVYPNPMGDRLTIEIREQDEDSPVVLYLVDTSGKVLATMHENKVKTIQMDISDLRLSSGIYYLRIETGDISEVRKLIME